MEVGKELEYEIFSFMFGIMDDRKHNGCLEAWNRNPWEAVSLYELEHYPENLALPLIVPHGLKLPRNVRKRLENEELSLMEGDPFVYTYPRVGATEIIFPDGAKGIVNRFGRLENADDIYNDEEDEEY